MRLFCDLMHDPARYFGEVVEKDRYDKVSEVGKI